MLWPQLIGLRLLEYLLSMMFRGHSSNLFRYVRGMLVFGKKSFSSGFLHIVPHVSTLAIMWIQTILLILGFVSLINLLVSPRES